MNKVFTPNELRAVANAMLKIGASKGIRMSKMKVIKLVYFAHGWCLGLSGKPLCSDPVEAWKFGPVFRKLYQALSLYRGDEIVNAPITDPFGDEFKPEKPFSEEETALIGKIIDVYSEFDAFQLSSLTHAKDSPWDKTVKDSGYAPIRNSYLCDFFKRKAETNA